MAVHLQDLLIRTRVLGLSLCWACRFLQPIWFFINWEMAISWDLLTKEVDYHLWH